jgi:hypothetical protein
MELLSKTLSWVRYVFCFPLLTIPSSQPKDPELLQNCDVEQQYFSGHCLAHREAGNVVDVFYVCVCIV